MVIARNFNSLLKGTVVRIGPSLLDSDGRPTDRDPPAGRGSSDLIRSRSEKNGGSQVSNPCHSDQHLAGFPTSIAIETRPAPARDQISRFIPPQGPPTASPGWASIHVCRIIEFLSELSRYRPMPSRPHALALSLALMSWSVVAVAESPSKEAIARAEQNAFASVEHIVKEEFEAARKTVKQHAKPSASEQVQDKAIGYIRMLYYNKASIYAECMAMGLTARAKSQPESQISEAEDCVNAKLRQVIAFSNLLTEYGSSLAPGSARCELAARLFEREILLPPYGFLKGDGAMLLDFQKYSECLKSPH
jgi:hypothetical protein